MITGIDHVQITIPKGKEAEARKFYCQTLGFSEIPKPETLLSRGGFWLRVGEDTIHIGVEDGIERSQTKAHIAYIVLDLDYWKKVITSLSIVIDDGIPIPGFRRFEFRDPFGNRVELISKIT